MNKLFVLIVAFSIAGCNQSSETKVLQHRIDSLDKRLATSYRPGFGEFMSNIQAHHSKLWFAGVNQNWKLADFEIHEIMEALDDIQQFQKDRKESKEIHMINPAIASIDSAIQQKNLIKFKEDFTLLTNTCNDCHKAVDFEFNRVKIPETSPFTNQDFGVKK